MTSISYVYISFSFYSSILTLLFEALCFTEYFIITRRRTPVFVYLDAFFHLREVIRLGVFLMEKAFPESKTKVDRRILEEPLAMES